MHALEQKRQALQCQLDTKKTRAQRNLLGQFSTPFPLALSIMKHSQGFVSPKLSQISFLDPAIGTGVFYSALLKTFGSKRIATATGFEIDPFYGLPSKHLWEPEKLNYYVNDFTKQNVLHQKTLYDLIICNPPYVRHHHIKEQKIRLKQSAKLASGMSLSGLAGLYCYFLGIAHNWMKEKAIAAWLIPSEFMDVNYGSEVKNYLLNRVTLLQIHRFNPEDTQFSDALVSSSIVWLKNELPPYNHKVKFSYGSSIALPKIEKEISASILRKESKWTRFPLEEARVEQQTPKLSDFFKISRGIATGDNKFFVLSLKDIHDRKLPIEQFKPILPSPRFLKNCEIYSNEEGIPLIDNQQFVLDCNLPIDIIEERYPQLYQYLQEGIESGVHERYLCKNRKIWYLQEERPNTCFYCTYIGRIGKNGEPPFRFILNHSKAIVSNSYLMLYPKKIYAERILQSEELKRQIVESLRTITSKALIAEGRVYGGGMHKLEPKELANVPASDISVLLQHHPHATENNYQMELDFRLN